MQSKKVTAPSGKERIGSASKGWGYFKKHRQTYFFYIPGIVLVFIFMYIPLGGLSIAFLDYDVFEGMRSPFVGFDNFKAIFTLPDFTKSISNTVWLSILNLLIKFPLPILFALLLNEIKDGFFKRFTQTVSYLPHFISTIAVVGLATSVFSSYGIINDIRLMFMGEETERMLFLAEQELFVPLNVGLTIWQTLGWGAVVYLATISGVDPELYDAAVVDGAGKFRQCLHVTLPSISVTVIMLLILEIGKLFKSNFDLVYGMQNSFIDFEVISTIVYKQGITNGEYSTATALGLMEGIMSLILILGTNYFSKKVSDASII